MSHWDEIGNSLDNHVSLMKTSRLARETAPIGQNLEITTRRKTGSFAASINTFTAGNAGSIVVKQAKDDSDDSSSLSSLSSPEPLDIEDLAAATTPRKRKRGILTPTTSVTEVSSIKVETQTPSRKTGIQTEDGSPAKIKKGRKQPAKKVINNESGEVTVHPPSNWEEIYSLVQEMRTKILAPVDTMGCESLAEDTRSPRVRTPYLLSLVQLIEFPTDRQNPGPTLPNPHRPNALLPDQRYHHRPRHEAPPNRTPLTSRLHSRRHPRRSPRNPQRTNLRRRFPQQQNPLHQSHRPSPPIAFPLRHPGFHRRPHELTRRRPQNGLSLHVGRVGPRRRDRCGCARSSDHESVGVASDEPAGGNEEMFGGLVAEGEVA